MGEEEEEKGANGADDHPGGELAPEVGHVLEQARLALLDRQVDRLFFGIAEPSLARVGEAVGAGGDLDGVAHVAGQVAYHLLKMS